MLSGNVMQRKMDKYILTYLAKEAMNLCVDEGSKCEAMGKYGQEASFQAPQNIKGMLLNVLIHGSTTEMVAILEVGWKYLYFNLPSAGLHSTDHRPAIIYALLARAALEKKVYLMSYLLQSMGSTKLADEDVYALISSCFINQDNRNDVKMRAAVGLLINKHITPQEKSVDEQFMLNYAQHVIDAALNDEVDIGMQTAELRDLLIDSAWQAPVYLLQHPYVVEADKIGKTYSSLADLWSVTGLRCVRGYVRGLYNYISEMPLFAKMLVIVVVLGSVASSSAYLLSIAVLSSALISYDVIDSLLSNPYLLASARELVTDIADFIYKPIEKVQSWVQRVSDGRESLAEVAPVR